MTQRLPRFIAIALLVFSLPVMAETKSVYTASSDTHRTAILELYTSEGCSSCPPADEFVASLPEAGINLEQVIPLALHVDYWDYIGWKDPYANSEFVSRQRKISDQNNSAVYTPQLVLNGKNVRDASKFKDVLEDINNTGANINLALQASYPSADELTVTLNATPEDKRFSGNSQIYIGLAENDLTSRINSGENAGRTLKHQHVVRVLKGPYALNNSDQTQLDERFKVDEQWNKGNLELFAFVQNKTDGDVLQALALPLK